MSADLVVVGGGPVGLAAAIAARSRGLDVTVVEPHEGMLDKACGEGLMPGALPLLAGLGVDPAGMPITGITYRQGERSVTHRFVGGAGRGVRRTELQRALIARADDLGVERVRGKVTALTPHNDGVELGLDGNTDGVTGAWVIAADGLHSTVARLAGLARPVGSSGRRYGIRRHYRVAPWADTVQITWADDCELYVTPVAEDEVGVAMLGRRGVDLEAAIAAVPELAERLGGAEPSSTRRGAGPFRQRTIARTAGRVLLAGDASGYVDAITGEGLRLGFAEALAAVDAVVARDATGYEREWRRITRGFRVTTTLLVRAATSPLRGAVVPLSAALPGRFGAVVESLAR